MTPHPVIFWPSTIWLLKSGHRCDQTRAESLLIGPSSFHFSAWVMLKVTGLQRIHTKARNEKKKKASGEETCSTHTQQDVVFKAICYSQWDAETTPVFVIKDILSFHKACVCVITPYVHHMCCGFRLFLNQAITGNSWHLAYTTVFLLICLRLWLCLWAFPQWLILPPRNGI